MSDPYVFVENPDPHTYTPVTKLYNYYQICTFPNPKTGKYHIRKFVLDERENFINIIEKGFDEDRYRKANKLIKDNEKKYFSTYCFDQIKYPTVGEVLLAQSDLLNNNYRDKYDFAQV